MFTRKQKYSLSKKKCSEIRLNLRAVSYNKDMANDNVLFFYSEPLIHGLVVKDFFNFIRIQCYSTHIL